MRIDGLGTGQVDWPPHPHTLDMVRCTPQPGIHKSRECLCLIPARIWTVTPNILDTHCEPLTPTNMSDSGSSSPGTDSISAQDDDPREPGPKLPSPAFPRDKAPSVSEPNSSANVEDKSSAGDLPDAGNELDREFREATGPMHVDWQDYVDASESDKPTSSLNIE